MSLAVHMTTASWICVLGLVLIGLYVWRQIRTDEKTGDRQPVADFDYRAHLNFNSERGRVR